jgi:hypothetical protein
MKNNPELLEQSNVVYKDAPIGIVSKIQLNPDGEFFIITVRINPTYKQMVHTNVTFYSENNQLVYYSLEEKGELLQPGTTIKGFNNKGELLLFQAWKILQDDYKNFIEWSNEQLNINR